MMASGGVCAVLDYEIDQITEYVADMAQRIILPTSQVSPSFRKFVSGLLSSTRLPSTTILLGLNYLARRTNLLNSAAPGAFKPTDGVVWRMLTIGLLLGSKFLDDNTFQNRSWSEVSGIPVEELNKLEHEWLASMQWNLYVNLDESDDFQAWLQSWAEWRQNKNMERKATLERLAPMPLAPIDTNVQRPRQYSTTYNGYNKTTSRERPESGYQSAYDQSAWMSSYPTPHLTPPSAPDSGLNTPEYMSATGGASRYNDWAVFNTAARAAYQPQTYATYIPSHHLASYHTPFISYHNGYASIWEGHGHITPECTCVNCNPYAKQQQHFMGHGYNQQVVA